MIPDHFRLRTRRGGEGESTMEGSRLNIVNARRAASARAFLLVFISVSLTMIAVGPAYGVRRTHVKHLFDITGNLNAASDVSVSPDGRIYVVDGVNSRVRVFDRSGRMLFSFGKDGSGSGEFRHPIGIDIDPSGRVYIADSGNHRVQIFDPDGAFVGRIDLPAGKKKPADPTDVAVDNSRNRCYVVDNDNHRILVYDLGERRLIETYGAPGTDKRMFRYPFLMALNEKKYLFIVDVINTRVQILSPDGLFVAFVGDWGVEKGEFFRPKGVAVDKNGRVFVSDSYLGVIQIFDANGNFFSVVGDPEKGGVKKFKTPAGLFVDKDNRLYVVEMLANRVGVYQVQGTFGEN